MNKENTRKGFTTTELVIVIAVIAILTTILIPTFSNLIGNAKDAANQRDANAIVTSWLSSQDNAEILTANTVLAIVVGEKDSEAVYLFENNQLSKKAVTSVPCNAIVIKYAKNDNGYDTAELPSNVEKAAHTYNQGEACTVCRLAHEHKFEKVDGIEICVCSKTK